MENSNNSNISSQKIEEFKIIDRYKYNPKYCLGQGSYGKVFIALDMQTNQQVALKQMDIRNFKDDDYLKNQLMSEVQIMKKLHHRNIVKFLDYFQSSKSYYFITEYCQDGDLSEYILNKKKLTEEQTLEIFFQLIEGFKELFKLGVIHRDLKPANILVDKGVFKICDFGFAKMANANSDMFKTIVGSPLYMSIQVLTGKPYTTKCDIWSFGIILFEMVTGDVPWKGMNEKDLANNIVKQTNVIKEKNFGKAIEKLLTKMLVLEEKKRISWEDLFALVEVIKNKKQINEIPNSPGRKKPEDKKKNTIFSPNNIHSEIIISDHLKAEITRFILQLNENRTFIGYLHFVTIEMFSNYTILVELLNKINAAFALEKFLVLLSQFIRHNSKEMIRSLGDRMIKNPELSKNASSFETLFKIVKKESFYHEKIYEEIMNLYLKNGFLIELKKDKELGNVIYGDYNEKDKEKFLKLVIFYGMGYLKEVSYTLYNKKHERMHLRLIDFIIDVLISFLRGSKVLIDTNFIEVLKEKSEIEDIHFYGEKVLLKYQKLLTIY